MTRTLLALGALVALAAAATAFVFSRGDSGDRRGSSATASSGSIVSVTARPSTTPSPPPTAAVRRVASVGIRAPSGANVRVGPGTDYTVVGALTAGEEATAVGRNADASWLVVDLAAGRGWVAAGVVDANGPVEYLPLMSPTPTRGPTPSVTVTPARTGTPTVSATPTGTRTGAPSATPAIGLPDLVLRDVSVGAVGRLTLVIGNAGPGPLVGRRVSVTGVDETGATVFTETTTALTIAAGGAVNVELSFRALTPGPLIVTLNPDGSIEEAATANNRRTITIPR